MYATFHCRKRPGRSLTWSVLEFWSFFGGEECGAVYSYIFRIQGTTKRAHSVDNPPHGQFMYHYYLYLYYYDYHF